MVAGSNPVAPTNGRLFLAAGGATKGLGPWTPRREARGPLGTLRPVTLILVTNDDGVHAPGLAVLASALETLGEVWIVAPEREQSACGHALTLHRPLRVQPVGERKFYVNGYTSRNIWLCCKKYLETKKAVQEVR